MTAKIARSRGPRKWFQSRTAAAITPRNGITTAAMLAFRSSRVTIASLVRARPSSVAGSPASAASAEGRARFVGGRPEAAVRRAVAEQGLGLRGLRGLAVQVVHEQRRHQRARRRRLEDLDAEVMRAGVCGREHFVLRDRAGPRRRRDVERDLAAGAGGGDAAPALQALGDRVVRPLLLDQRVGDRDGLGVGGPVQAPARERLQRRLREAGARGGRRRRRAPVRLSRPAPRRRRSASPARRAPSRARASSDPWRARRTLRSAARARRRRRRRTCRARAGRSAAPRLSVSQACAAGSSATTSRPGVPSADTGIRTVPAPRRAGSWMRDQTASSGTSSASTSAPQAQSGSSGPISEPAPISATVRPGSASHSGCSTTRPDRPREGRPRRCRRPTHRASCSRSSAPRRLRPP